MDINHFSTSFFANSFPNILFISFVYTFGVQVYKNFVKPHRLEKYETPNVDLACTMWNLGMCIFSFYGAISTGLLFSSIIEKNLLFNTTGPQSNYDLSCASNNFTSFLEFKMGFQMGLLYLLSKPLELIDTVFLMLKRKPISTLHWTHHLLTMLYCWYAGTLQSMEFFLLFCFLNLTVHAIMYGYYFLQWAVGLPNYISKCITFIQILQFVIGLTWTLMWTNKIDHFSLSITLTMYSYYLVLFVNFYYRKYHSLCCMCHTNIAKLRCHKCNNHCCTSCLTENGCTLCVQTSSF
jgi:hypothetical protein